MAELGTFMNRAGIDMPSDGHYHFQHRKAFFENITKQALGFLLRQCQVFVSSVAAGDLVSIPAGSCGVIKSRAVAA